MSTNLIESAKKLRTAIDEFLTENEPEQSAKKPVSPEQEKQIIELRKALVELKAKDPKRVGELYDKFDRKSLPDMTPDELLDLSLEVGLG